MRVSLRCKATPADTEARRSASALGSFRIVTSRILLALLIKAIIIMKYNKKKLYIPFVLPKEINTALE